MSSKELRVAIYMNKYRLNQILTTLLMPYREMEFYHKNDVIKDLRYSFYQAANGVGKNSEEWRNLEKNYYENVKKLEYFIANNHDINAYTIDDIKMMFDLFYPEERTNYIYDRTINQDENQKEAINELYYENIFRVAKSLLTFRDGEIAIRTWINKEEETGEKDIFDHHGTFDKVSIWNMLNRLVMTDVFIIAFYLESGHEISMIARQSNHITMADRTLKQILEKGVAETHFHFNAGMNPLGYWSNVMHPDIWINNKWHIEQEIEARGLAINSSIVIFRMLYAFWLESEFSSIKEFIEKNDLKEIEVSIWGALNSLYEGRENDKELNRTILKKFEDTFCTEEEKIHIDNGQDEGILLKTIYKKYVFLVTDEEWIFLYKIMKYLRENSNDIFSRELFLQYLRVKNNYFHILVQTERIAGLNNFKKYYDQIGFYNATLENQNYSIFRNELTNSNIKKLEIRMVPRVNFENKSDEELKKEAIKQEILKQVKGLLESYLEYLKGQMGEKESGKQLSIIDEYVKEGKIVCPSIGIIYHFLKRDFLDNRVGNACWNTKFNDLDFYSKHVIPWRKNMVDFATALEELRNEIPFLHEYIVGIDTASEEVAMEPWIVAPIYASIRNKKIVKPKVFNEEKYQLVNNLGFTYHVGEEFRHILSGFRHIDEVIEHLNYKPGDRLGHALVLGVDIESWMRNNEVVTIPILEYFEDLLWLWGLGIYHGVRINNIFSDILEGQILDLAEQIYGDIQGMTIHMLYAAYQDKFKLNYETVFEIEEETIGNDAEKRNCHFCKFFDCDKKDSKGRTGTIWNKEKIICTYFCPHYNMKFRNPIFIPVNESDLLVFSEIQDYLINKIERMGAYIETNPTSNLVIGEIQEMDEHYIMKLNSKGVIYPDENANAVLISINTDDPVIFNTNVENEIAYIYYAMVHHGYNKEDILNWIDKVRQFGMDSSFIKKVRTPSVQIKEMKEIITEIDKRLQRGKL